MKTRHILYFILSGTMLVACTQSRLVKHNRIVAKPWTITLLVTGNGAGAEMKVRKDAMPGCINQDDGCMVFGHNETGKITFDMSGNDTGFHITELKICMDAVVPVPEDKDCPLPIANALDFSSLDPNGRTKIPSPLTGKIKWDYAENVKTFELFDRNLMEQKYYYLVIACDSLGNCPVADPLLDNKGLK